MGGCDCGGCARSVRVSAPASGASQPCMVRVIGLLLRFGFGFGFGFGSGLGLGASQPCMRVVARAPNVLKYESFPAW